MVVIKLDMCVKKGNIWNIKSKVKVGKDLEARLLVFKLKLKGGREYSGKKAPLTCAHYQVQVYSLKVPLKFD